MSTKPTERKVVNNRLDKLYSSNVKCPYCRARIPKFVAECARCGITKVQISQASHQEAKAILSGKEEGIVMKSRRRPDDLNVRGLLLRVSLFGMFGAHNFYVGRKIRGHIALWCMVALIISVSFFSMGTVTADMMDAHPWRRAFEGTGFPFPLDVFGLIAIVMWFVDWFAIVLFNNYKYPVRINATPKDIKKKAP